MPRLFLLVKTSKARQNAFRLRLRSRLRLRLRSRSRLFVMIVDRQQFVVVTRTSVCHHQSQTTDFIFVHTQNYLVSLHCSQLFGIITFLHTDISRSRSQLQSQSQS